MKYLVETSGDFMLLDIATGVEISESRPSVVRPTAFVTACATRGQLRMLHNDLPDEASDADFAEFWAADKAIAVDAYMAKFSAEAIEDPIEPATGVINAGGPIIAPAITAAKIVAKPAAKPRAKKG
jgi:hypothetical protein